MSQALRATTAETLTPMTTVAFDRWLDGVHDDTRWELLGGQLVAMPPPSLPHALVASNLDALLVPKLHPPCRVFRNELGIQSGDDDQRTYRPVPDLMVHCGPRGGRRRFLTDPLIVVEILSPSTMHDDRGIELGFYQSLQTLRHLVLIYQDQVRVEHFRRTDLGEAIGCGVDLAELYREVDLDAPPEP